MTTFVNNTQKDLPTLIRVADVAQLLSVSRSTIHKLLQSGELVGSNINTRTAERQHVRITRVSLLKFYKKRFGHCLLRALNHGTEN